MTQYNNLNAKLSNSQLNKFKSAIKNETEVVLRKGIYRARKSKGVIAKSQGRGINRAAEGVLRAGYGPSSSSALQTKFDFNTTSSFN